MTQYDDFKVLSPEKMDFLARKYFDEIKSLSPNFDCFELKCSSEYKKIITTLLSVFSEMKNTHKFCSVKFYNSKRQQIENILKNLSQLTCNEEPIEYNILSKNYCHLISICINKLCDALEMCVTILNNKLSPEEITYLHDLMKNIVIIIQEENNLLGFCKYRVF